MTVVLKNNAVGYLAIPISASDVGLALVAGDGANFPSLSVGEYFYATIVATNGEYEIVKVTARVNDTFTVLRAQDNSTAYSFAAGAKIEMRVTVAAVEDAVTDLVATSIAGSLIASAVTIVDAGGYYAATTVESALQEVTAANKIRIADAGNFYAATNVEAALQEVAVASNMDIVDAGSYYVGTNVEAALQEAAHAATIRITDPGNYYTSSTVDGALQEAAQAVKTKITDTGSYYTGTNVEDALQEVGVALAAISPTPTAAQITVADAGNYYIGTTVEAVLQEVNTASKIRITDAANYYAATNVELALQEIASDVASISSNRIHAICRITAGAAISGTALGVTSVASGGTGIYNVTLTTAISNANNIIPIATADHNSSTTASYTASCDVTSTSTIQVRIWSNGTNPVATNLGFCLVVYNTT